MKYYYNGKLVRTSNNTYTHAYVDYTGRVCTCSKDPDKLIARRNQRLANYKTYYENCTDPLRKNNLKEFYEQEKMSKIVELEMRA